MGHGSVFGGRRVAAWLAAPALVAVGAGVSLAPAASAAPHRVPAAPAARAAWTARRLPLPPGGAANSFAATAISCPTARRCAGGGNFAESSFNFQGAALLSWSGRKWAALQAPLPAGAAADPHASVASMSCPSATRCFAGGQYLGTLTGDEGMLLSGSGKKWSVAKAPLPAHANNNPDAAVSGMSCRSATWCRAVGQYVDVNGGTHGLLLRWSGRKWSAAAAPTPAGSSTASLDAVSCASTTRCVAVGWYVDALSRSQPLLVSWTGRAWKTVGVPLPAGAAADPQSALEAVSCPSTTRCVAVGDYVDSAGNSQGVLLTLSAKKWAAARAPLPAGAGANPWVRLNAVSCPTASHCVAGGGYEDAASNPLGLLLTWSGRRWKAATAPAIAYQLNGVSCPSLTRCVAVSAGIGQPVVLTGP